MIVFDNYEISGCRRIDAAGLASAAGDSVEPCADSEAEFWTLYGHVEGEGVSAIGDFNSRRSAEKVFERITGTIFEGSYTASRHLRQMHAAGQLKALIEQFLAIPGLEGRDPAWAELAANARTFLNNVLDG